jgi:probable F420-dependent oxidoreductase
VTLRVGIQLPEVERDVRWPEYVALARAAEEVGFDSIWLGDHLLYRGDGQPERGPWEVWTLLAGLAAVTERVKLGPLVACTSFHPPAVLAKMAATVDEVSGGRLVLGLGAGWNEPDFRAFGLPFDHLASRFEEAFEIVRKLVAGERVTFSGRYYEVDHAVLLPRPSRSPPLMIGSTGPRVLRAALPHVDVWNSWYDLIGNAPEGFERDSQLVSQLAEEVGRDASEIERSACVSVALSDRRRRSHVRDDVPPIEGDAGTILRRVREFGDAGADEVILIVTPCTEEAIRLVGEAL